MFPGEGNGNPFAFTFGKSHGWRACWAMIHGVAKGLDMTQVTKHMLYICTQHRESSLCVYFRKFLRQR